MYVKLFIELVHETGVDEDQGDEHVNGALLGERYREGFHAFFQRQQHLQQLDDNGDVLRVKEQYKRAMKRCNSLQTTNVRIKRNAAEKRREYNFLMGKRQTK